MTFSAFGFEWSDKGERVNARECWEAGNRDAKGWSVPDHINQAIEDLDKNNPADQRLIREYNEGWMDGQRWGC